MKHEQPLESRDWLRSRENSSGAAGLGNSWVSNVYGSSVAPVRHPSVFTVTGMSIHSHVHASRPWQAWQL